MTDDFLDLVSINDEIARRENVGDAAYFEGLLAPVFAMRRRGRRTRTTTDRLSWQRCAPRRKHAPARIDAPLTSTLCWSANAARSSRVWFT